ncbi:uncharacterized protein [Diadema antillarum]|uniref:uncharacterized protein n=1 Tax=Diadema antillarum TaxID=105358 RepID=UPI003A8571E5
MAAEAEAVHGVFAQRAAVAIPARNGRRSTMEPSRTRRLRAWLRERWGWVVTAAAFFINLIIYNVLYCYSIFLVPFQKEFGTGTAVTGWVGSLAIGLTCWTGLIANPLIERFNNRLVMVVGICLSFVGLLITSFMPNLQSMYASYSLMYGIGAGFTIMSSANLLLRYFPTANSTRAISIFMSGANIGMMAMGPLIHIQVKTIGWRNAFRVMGSLMMIVGLPLSYLYDQPSPATLKMSSKDHGNRVKKDAANSKRDEETEIGRDSLEKEQFLPDVRDITGLSTDANSNVGTKVSVDKWQVLNGTNASYSPTIPSSLRELPQTNGNVVSYSKLPSSDEDATASERDRDGDVPIDAKEGTTHSEQCTDQTLTSIHQKRRSLLVRVGVALTYPDVWLFCIATFCYGSCASFFYVHMVRYMLSIGFTDENGAQAVVAIGVSVLAGKFLLSSVGDCVPFPKLFLFLIATFVGIALSVSLFFVTNMAHVFTVIVLMGLFVTSICDSLPYSVCNQIFGLALGLETWTLVTCFHGTGYLLASVFGVSVDLTGSYDGAIWATIVIYGTAGTFCMLVPVYQRLFARERFFLLSSMNNSSCCVGSKVTDIENDVDFKRVKGAGAQLRTDDSVVTGEKVVGEATNIGRDDTHEQGNVKGIWVESHARDCNKCDVRSDPFIVEKVTTL